MVAEDPWGDGPAAAKTARKAVEDQKAGLPERLNQKALIGLMHAWKLDEQLKMTWRGARSRWYHLTNRLFVHWRED